MSHNVGAIARRIVGAFADRFYEPDPMADGYDAEAMVANATSEVAEILADELMHDGCEVLIPKEASH